MKSFLSLLLSAVLSIFGVGLGECPPTSGDANTATAEQLALFESIVESETAWIASLQLENGAIPMTYTANGTVKMNPYFADFAALALLDRADDYADNVKKYMDWHFAHLNTASSDYNGVDGTIYDYEITLADGKITQEKSLGSYDSTDSYAATFLMVLNKYYDKTGDSAYILNNVNNIQRVVNAMLSTLHNGLTMAKPDYEIKYLMDNCEVYAGARACGMLFTKVSCDQSKAIETQCAEAVDDIYKAVENKLWKPLSGNYKVAVKKTLNLDAIKFSWDEYYPSATAQLFPIAFGLICPRSDRALKLYNKFCDKYDWENFDYPDAFYWGSNVYTAAVVNDLDRVVTYMENYKGIAETHAYPLYNADAGKVSMAAQIMIDRAAA